MSSSRSIVRVLFRVAAGRRLGFGHLARALSLARALGVPATLSVRGTAEAGAIARGMGARLAAGSLARALREQQPALVVIDDPDPRAAARALDTARRQGVRVASIHDLGIAGIASDLAIDGSLARSAALPARATLMGSRYAILDPRLTALRQQGRRADRRVLISLGGGPRRTLGLRIARAVRLAHPDARVTLAGGFAARHAATAVASGATSITTSGAASGATSDGVQFLPSPSAFRPALAATDVAVLAGGVTLYEAAALGVPSVALAIVPAQTPTVRAFAAARAACDAGRAGASGRGSQETISAVVRHVTRLLGDRALRRSMAGRARGLIDGRGAARAASALRKLVTSS